MKKDIHPTYHSKAVTKCACGQVIEIPSTQEETQVEICFNCHPFYTGKDKTIDAANRIKKFKEKMAKTQGMTKTNKKQKRAKKDEEKADKE